ncbi:hypothetical protein [Sphingobium limneticum]|uniref:Uncharacterized protein n=1 Tax=Sphingobium limneticum TaxID=1007511 RepID=A0A5J5I8T1_9SPHN|nr:hypothetical protein [Sphingobium limneticum]KAA9018228.1 hypothetical protein F4U96_08930 [Sphingobium limneticum]KAA9030864.1 hypothetical protein F4U95_08880 [Sphingobium limneticum]
MKPDIPAVLEDVARKLRETILPDLKGFQANMVGMTAAMLDMTAEAWNGAADRLVQENAALATLLAQGSALTGDPAFRDAAKEEAEDLKISTLERINDQRRRALIALQAQIETDQSAQALNSAIWDELRASTERRRVTLANF